MPTIVIGNNTGDDYSGTDDTSIYGAHADTNYGENSTLYFSADDPCFCLLNFSGLSSISSGAISVSAASFFIYHSNANTSNRDK